MRGGNFPALFFPTNRRISSAYASLTSQSLLPPREASEAKSRFLPLLRHPLYPHKTRFHCELGDFSTASGDTESAPHSPQGSVVSPSERHYYINGTQLGMVGNDAINPTSVDGTASRYTAVAMPSRQATA